jgi:hypothetical protein
MDRCSVSTFGAYRAGRLGMSQMRWRAAARIVAPRCEDLLRSGVHSLVFASGLYLSGLDTEEATAAQTSQMLPRATECSTTG